MVVDFVPRQVYLARAVPGSRLRTSLGRNIDEINGFHFDKPNIPQIARRLVDKCTVSLKSFSLFTLWQVVYFS